MGEVANTILKMLRQCGGNSIVILQVIEYDKGQIQTSKSSRNFQIREIGKYSMISERCIEE